MKDKIVLITGGTGGIGKQTALGLAKAGAEVIVTGRSQASGEAAVQELRQASGNQRVDLLLADLATQAGVRSLASQFASKHSRLDVLINNAGLVTSERQLTVDGIESIFAVNVVTPFLLTHLLMPSLKASPAARVVNLSGGSHPAKIELDNLQAERSFAGLETYSQAKLVMMAVMYEFALQLQGSALAINVCYPGQASTAMTQSVNADMLPGMMKIIFPLFKLFVRPDGGKSARRAAQSSIFLASSAQAAGVNGKYYDTNSKPVSWPAPVLDSQIRQTLWAVTSRLSGLT